MLQLSAKSTGLFESFYSSLKPIVMIKETKDIAGEGRITDKELNDKHEKKFPFSFHLKVHRSCSQSSSRACVFPSLFPRHCWANLTHYTAARPQSC
jgi:hypothetical protein